MSHKGPRNWKLTNTEPSMTKQCFKSASDINNIMRKAVKTGMLPTVQCGFFGDVTRIPVDYQASLNFIMEAQERFDALPAAIRDRFGNDAGALMAFIDDPKNATEARALGLIAPLDVEVSKAEEMPVKGVSDSQKPPAA